MLTQAPGQELQKKDSGNNSGGAGSGIQTRETAVRADRKVFTKGKQNNFNRRETGKLFCEFARPLDTKNQGKILSFKTVTEESIVANFLKTGRQDMHQKSADEFRARNRDGFLITGFIVASQKGDHAILDAYDSGVGDGNLVSIVSKILNGITIAVESLLDETIPFHGVKFVAEELPHKRIFKGRAGFRETELPVVK